MTTKTILISGGSSGLGAALVTAYLAQGHRVATFSRKHNAFIAAQQAHDQQAAHFYWEALDAEDSASLAPWVARVQQHFGTVDVLINNAAKLSEGLLAFTSDQDIHALIQCNLVAPIILTKACSTAMLRQNSGVILNISSINAIRGHKGVALYSASKAALDGLTRSLARELGPANIRINALAPGFFETDLVAYLSPERRQQIRKRTPLNRLGQLADVSQLAQFMCSDAASFLTGQTIVLDGGMTC
ncbi:MAG: SDR family oxidoreductase [Neisseriaceae bacterium]|nr:SDR family oxidoreductase [Neisseriaceae bacterium]MBP6862421.1 SDR family oxidoreductase [Neisseriaceae bacterium]